MVGKQPKASGAGIARSWPNFQVRTASDFVGFTPSTGHSATEFSNLEAQRTRPEHSESEQALFFRRHGFQDVERRGSCHDSFESKTGPFKQRIVFRSGTLPAVEGEQQHQVD